MTGREAARIISFVRRSPTKEGRVRTFISIQQTFGIHMEEMTRVAERAQPWNRGACRRR